MNKKLYSIHISQSQCTNRKTLNFLYMMITIMQAAWIMHALYHCVMGQGAIDTSCRSPHMLTVVFFL